jgi:hypothetical protein
VRQEQAESFSWAPVTLARVALGRDQPLVRGTVAASGERDPPPARVLPAAEDSRPIDTRKAVAKYPKPEDVELDAGCSIRTNG